MAFVFDFFSKLFISEIETREYIVVKNMDYLKNMFKSVNYIDEKDAKEILEMEYSSEEDNQQYVSDNIDDDVNDSDSDEFTSYDISEAIKKKEKEKNESDNVQNKQSKLEDIKTEIDNNGRLSSKYSSFNKKPIN